MAWFDMLVPEQTFIPEPQIALRLFLAALFGAIIGFEREVRDRPAGLRTNMLTSLAAALFTIITFEIYHHTRTLEDDPNVDPIRIIEAVTAGVAFLAAGTIIHGAGTVHGLTTGAALWMAGAVGVATGAGYYQLALMAVVLAVLIIVLINSFERRVLETKEMPGEERDGGETK